MRVGNAERAGFAWTMFASLRDQIREFEAKLNEGQEVAAMFANFGSTVTLHVREITYRHPHLVVFIGEDDDGRRRELLQHVSQVSLLLSAVPSKEEKRRPIGFRKESESAHEGEEREDDEEAE